MSNHRAFGNIKMKGKKVVKNPCPCCDPIENKKDDLVEKTQRTEVEQWVHDHVRWVHRAYYIAPEFSEDKEVLEKEISRLENLDPAKHSYPQRLESLKKRLEKLKDE